jgi:hypothetical protein
VATPFFIHLDTCPRHELPLVDLTRKKRGVGGLTDSEENEARDLRSRGNVGRSPRENREGYGKPREQQKCARFNGIRARTPVFEQRRWWNLSENINRRLLIFAETFLTTRVRPARSVKGPKRNRRFSFRRSFSAQKFAKTARSPDIPYTRRAGHTGPRTENKGECGDILEEGKKSQSFTSEVYRASKKKEIGISVSHSGDVSIQGRAKQM